MKKLKKILLIAVAAVAVVIVIGLICIDWITKVGIEIGATTALGVTTQLDEADVGVFSGRFAMQGLNIANPEGFRSASFLKLADGEVSISLRSLTQDEVVIPNLTLTGIELTLEKNNGKGNYNVILENLSAKEPQQQPSEPPQDDSQESGKTIIIHDLLIRDITVHAEVIPLGGELSSITIDVPEIHLKDVGSNTGTGSLVAQLSGTLVEALLSAVTKKAGDLLPNTITQGVDSGLQNLNKLGKQAEEVGEAIEQAAEELGQGLENVLKGFQIGPQKEEKKN